SPRDRGSIVQAQRNARRNDAGPSQRRRVAAAAPVSCPWLALRLRLGPFASADTSTCDLRPVRVTPPGKTKSTPGTYWSERGLVHQFSAKCDGVATLSTHRQQSRTKAPALRLSR